MTYNGAVMTPLIVNNVNSNTALAQLMGVRSKRFVTKSPDEGIVRVVMEKGQMPSCLCGLASEAWFFPRTAPSGLAPTVSKRQYAAWAENMNTELANRQIGRGQAFVQVTSMVILFFVMIYGTTLTTILTESLVPLAVIPIATVVLMFLNYQCLFKRPRRKLREFYDSIEAKANAEFGSAGVEVVQGRELMEYYGKGVNLDPDVYFSYWDFRLPGALTDKDTAFESAIGFKGMEEPAGKNGAIPGTSYRGPRVRDPSQKRELHAPPPPPSYEG